MIETDMNDQIAVTEEMQERFAAWFRQNYPGPDTIIGNPDWHAPRVFRAALHCIRKDAVSEMLAAACAGREAVLREAAAELRDNGEHQAVECILAMIDTTDA